MKITKLKLNKKIEGYLGPEYTIENVSKKTFVSIETRKGATFSVEIAQDIASSAIKAGWYIIAKKWCDDDPYLAFISENIGKTLTQAAEILTDSYLKMLNNPSKISFSKALAQLDEDDIPPHPNDPTQPKTKIDYAQLWLDACHEIAEQADQIKRLKNEVDTLEYDLMTATLDKIKQIVHERKQENIRIIDGQCTKEQAVCLLPHQQVNGTPALVPFVVNLSYQNNELNQTTINNETKATTLLLTKDSAEKLKAKYTNTKSLSSLKKILKKEGFGKYSICQFPIEGKKGVKKYQIYNTTTNQIVCPLANKIGQCVALMMDWMSSEKIEDMATNQEKAQNLENLLISGGFGNHHVLYNSTLFFLIEDEVSIADLGNHHSCHENIVSWINHETTLTDLQERVKSYLGDDYYLQGWGQEWHIFKKGKGNITQSLGSNIHSVDRTLENSYLKNLAEELGVESSTHQVHEDRSGWYVKEYDENTDRYESVWRTAKELSHTLLDARKLLIDKGIAGCSIEERSGHFYLSDPSDRELPLGNCNDCLLNLNDFIDKLFFQGLIAAENEGFFIQYIFDETRGEYGYFVATLNDQTKVCYPEIFLGKTMGEVINHFDEYFKVHWDERESVNRLGFDTYEFDETIGQHERVFRTDGEIISTLKSTRDLLKTEGFLDYSIEQRQGIFYLVPSSKTEKEVYLGGCDECLLNLQEWIANQKSAKRTFRPIARKPYLIKNLTQLGKPLKDNAFFGFEVQREGKEIGVYDEYELGTYYSLHPKNRSEFPKPLVVLGKDAKDCLAPLYDWMEENPQLAVQVETEEEKQEKFPNRNTYLGASDAADAMGISPYKSPIKLFLEKTGQIKPDEPSEAMCQGLKYEDYILGIFEEKTGLTVTDKQGEFTHSEYEFIKCHVDGLVPDAVVESKRVEFGQLVWSKGDDGLPEWGESGTDRLPFIYIIQPYIQMMCTGKHKAYIPVAFVEKAKLSKTKDLNKALKDFRIYELNYDEKLADAILEKVVAFWYNVKEEIVPEFNFERSDALEQLELVYNRVDDNEVNLGQKGVELYDQWREEKRQERMLREQLKQLEEKANSTEAKLYGLAGNASKAVINGRGILERTLSIKEAHIIPEKVTPAKEVPEKRELKRNFTWTGNQND